MGTLGALLADRRAALVGRDDELASLMDLVERDTPIVAVVHGVAGVGKTSLLGAFERRARSAGARVVAVDGRAVEPTPRAVRAAIATAADCGPDLAGLGGGERLILTIDSADRLRLLDGWLRQELLPSLPDSVRVALATREPPGAIWRAAFGPLLRSVALGPLTPADACAVLRRAGLDGEQAAWVNGVVHGHPLSLRLAASTLLERPDAPEDAVLPAVAQELAALYLDALDTDTREALDATCVLRRVTLTALAAVLPGTRPQDAWERLAALPFVELGREGLVVHDTVREAVTALLRAADPVRHRGYRAAAWRQIRRELADAAGPARWAPLADMIALVDEPMIREAFFASAPQHYAVERARATDRDDIEAIVARHEPPAQVRLCRAWWEAAPEAFRVARGPRGDVVAFSVLCEPDTVPSRLLVSDPLCRPWRAHLRASPVLRGQRILVARFALAWATGVAPSPCLAGLLHDVERACLEAGPALRRVYATAPADPGLRRLGYVTLPGEPAVDLDGRSYRAVVCDLGPDSVAGWVSDLAARDLNVRDAVLDPDGRELVLDGRRVTLTALECDVLGYMRDRAGAVVSREELLREVWGYDWTGGSNVVEVAISALRRKLGDRASAVETVRGRGYRLRGL